LNLLHTIEPLIEIRYYLVRRVAQCVASLHFSVAERALTLLHNPGLLCLIKQFKNELLPQLVDSLISNVHRNEAEFISLLDENGIYTQKGFYVDLFGSHWSKSVRGFSIECLKLLIENIDRSLIEQISNTYAERLFLKELERNKRNKQWRVLEKQLKGNNSKQQQSSSPSKHRKKSRDPQSKLNH